MTGAKAFTLGYVAQQSRYDDFHRTAAERRRAFTPKPRRRRLVARLRVGGLRPASRVSAARS